MYLDGTTEEQQGALGTLTTIDENPSSSFSFLPTGSGFQSNIGPSYAGGMVYDYTRHSVYLTGSSYGHQTKKTTATSHCFFAHLKMVELDWTKLEMEQEADVQACSSIAQVYDELYLAGLTEDALTGSTATVDEDALDDEQEQPVVKRYGIVSRFTRDIDQPDWTLAQNAWIQDDQQIHNVQSPVAMYLVEADSFFVASMSSTGASLNNNSTDYEAEPNPEFPNPTLEDHLTYGSDHFVTLQKFTLSGDEMVQVWKTEIQPADTGGSEAEAYVDVTGISVIDNTLVVCGSTGVPGDRNGYVAMMGADASTLGTAQYETTGMSDTHIFDSTNHQDDWVMNICSSLSDKDNFYVVGATKGSMAAGPSSDRATHGSVHSFVTKMDLKTNRPIWTQQLHVVSASKDTAGASSAYGCSVDNSQGLIYVAGVVKNGASMDYPSTTSAGNDDIFVTQLDTGTGHIQWLNQFGSSGDESLARNGGIATDMEGHAVIYGDTTGELYRARSWHESRQAKDVFVVTLSKKDGSFHQSVESMKHKVWIEVWVALLLAALVYGIIYYRRLPRGRLASMVLALFQEENAGLMAKEENGAIGLNDLTANGNRPYRDYEPKDDKPKDGDVRPYRDYEPTQEKPKDGDVRPLMVSV
jgi:hypothetical protein